MDDCRVVAGIEAVVEDGDREDCGDGCELNLMNSNVDGCLCVCPAYSGEECFRIWLGGLG